MTMGFRNRPRPGTAADKLRAFGCIWLFVLVIIGVGAVGLAQLGEHFFGTDKGQVQKQDGQCVGMACPKAPLKN